MKIKTVKQRNRFGIIEEVEMTDIDGIIAITAEVWRQQPDNEKCIEFFAWMLELGHKPTDREFREWLNAKGVQSVKMDVIEDRN